MKKPSFFTYVLLVLSAICIFSGFLGFQGEKDLMECVAPYAAPQPDEDGSVTRIPLLDALQAMRSALPGAIVSAAIIQSANEAALPSGRTAACSVQGTAPGWFDLYHRTQVSGSRFTERDSDSEKRVAIVDDLLAYALWGTTEVVGNTLRLSGASFQVVGVVRHPDQMLQTKKPTLYMPLLQALRAGIEADIQVLAAGGARRSVFQTTAGAVMPKGTVYDLQQERMRITLPLRYLAVFLSVILLSKALFALNSMSRHSIRAWKEKSAHVYGTKMILPSILLLLQWVLTYGAWLAAVYVVLHSAAAPMHVFTQWMPKDPSDLSGYKDIWIKAMEERSSLTVFLTESIQKYRNLALLFKAGTAMLLLALIIPRKKEP